MNMIDFLEDVRNIEETLLTEANFGMGHENKIKIKITNEDNYTKWDYCIKKMHEDLKESVKILKRYPEVIFIFPNNEEDLEIAVEKTHKLFNRKFYLIDQPPNRELTIITKVTNLCNLDCQYCYDMPFRKKLGHNGILTLSKLEKMIELAAKFAENVTIIWHGGESTLAGKEYFREVYTRILPKYPYATFEHGIQTNATLLDEEWYELFKEYGISPGSSYNATQEDLRHTLETNELGDKEHDVNVVLRKCKEAEKCGLGMGVIDVFTKKNHHKLKEIYEFYKEIGIDACFNAIHDSGEATKHDFLFITKEDKEEYRKVTTDYFKHWLTDKSDSFFIDRFASENLSLIMTGGGTVCQHGGRCVGRWLSINSNGDIYPCDRALENKYRVGNVLEFSNMRQMFRSRAYMNFKNERETKLKTCTACPVYDYCKGSCPMADIDEHGTAARKNSYVCDMFKLDLKCMYKALHEVTLDELNVNIRNYFIKNILFLPKEIPNLFNELGIKAGQELQYNAQTCKLYSKEFDMFSSINPPDQDKWLNKVQEDLVIGASSPLEDTRVEKAKNALKKRAEKIEESLRL